MQAIIMFFQLLFWMKQIYLFSGFQDKGTHKVLHIK